MPTPKTVLDSLLRSVGAAIYIVLLVFVLCIIIRNAYVIIKERNTKMELQVYQIDAWIELDGTWTYNNSIPICRVSVNGVPTTRKILKALRDKLLLPSRNELPVKVDDYYTYDGIWCVQQRSDSRPLFDLQELV